MPMKCGMKIGGSNMSLLFTGLAVCCVAGVLKGKAMWLAATAVFGALAVMAEIKEERMVTCKRVYKK